MIFSLVNLNLVHGSVLTSCNNTYQISWLFSTMKVYFLLWWSLSYCLSSQNPPPQTHLDFLLAFSKPHCALMAVSASRGARRRLRGWSRDTGGGPSWVCFGFVGVSVDCVVLPHLSVSPEHHLLTWRRQQLVLAVGFPCQFFPLSQNEPHQVPRDKGTAGLAKPILGVEVSALHLLTQNPGRLLRASSGRLGTRAPVTPELGHH